MILFLLLCHQLVSASTIDRSSSNDFLGFSFKNLRIYHQMGWRNLSLFLEFQSENEEDLRAMKNFVNRFLETYYRETDFWELVNVNLIQALARSFPSVSKIESVFSLAPDTLLAFPRESRVLYVKNQPLKESFSFTKLRYALENPSFKAIDFQVLFHMRENPTSSDYQDYRWVDAAIEDFFKLYPLAFSDWKQLKPLLESFLLDRFPTFASIEVTPTRAH